MFDPARLVFIDETAASTKMVRLRGRCPRSERLLGSVPHGHWKTITLVAGLRHDAIVAPFVIDGPMNGRVFLTIPALSRRIRSILRTVSKKECLNFFRHAGYE
jgi:hypothetical protein